MHKFFPILTGAVLLFNLAIAAKDYNGAELYSKNTVKYGRFDVRMRAISGSGIVSSFFLYYNNSYLGSPEPWREIDVEVLGKTNNVFQSNIITGNKAQQIKSEILDTVDNLAIRYHTYTVEWTPNYIAWLFDGVEIRHTTGSQVTDCQSKEMSYRSNLWISDVPDWVGVFNPSILPACQFINWIKYSKYTPGTGTNGSDFTPEWQDDFNSFDNSRWAKGDWTFDGNLVDFSQNNIVIKNGYCIICLTKAGQTGYTGNPPEDQGTSIINPKVIPSMKMPSSKYPSRGESFLFSLDGRLVSRNATFPGLASSGMWISKKNNTVVQKTSLHK